MIDIWNVIDKWNIRSLRGLAIASPIFVWLLAKLPQTLSSVVLTGLIVLVWLICLSFIMPFRFRKPKPGG